MHAIYTPLPLGPEPTDIILLALLQSRLQERARQLDRDLSSQLRSAIHSPQDMALLNAERELEAVKDAADRLHRGSYGLCAVCHGRIGWDLLLATPQRSTCASCHDTLGGGGPSALVPAPDERALRCA